MDPQKLAALQAALNQSLVKPQNPNQPGMFDKLKAMFSPSPNPMPSQTPSASPIPGSNLEQLQYGVNKALGNQVDPQVAARIQALQKLRQGQ